MPLSWFKPCLLPLFPSGKQDNLMGMGTRRGGVVNVVILLLAQGFYHHRRPFWPKTVDVRPPVCFGSQRFDSRSLFHVPIASESQDGLCLGAPYAPKQFWNPCCEVHVSAHPRNTVVHTIEHPFWFEKYLRLKSDVNNNPIGDPGAKSQPPSRYFHSHTCMCGIRCW